MKIEFLKDHDHRPVPAAVTEYKKGHVADLPKEVAEQLIADKIARPFAETPTPAAPGNKEG